LPEPYFSFFLPGWRRTAGQLLLELEGHERQASALKQFVKRAKSMKPLDPSVRSLSESLDALHEKNSEWKLLINTPVEIDS
jgi:hypothetical protein